MFLIKFSVIYIDFNYEGKPGEKSLRSLDQVSYNDGVNRGKSSFKDSYGNPVEYDTLDQIDAKQASKTSADPNKFKIPGYASGILQPHEVPTRSNFNGETSRSVDDDRIHFIDPLQNSFQNSDKSFQAPSPSLSPPLGSPNNQPILIPRPNIDLQETPQAPVDDPLNHQLNPPKDNNFAAPPSVPLEGPHGKIPQFTLSSNLATPQIPTEGVFIPRPNLDIGETPIDTNRNGPLNQGLLPPGDGSQSTFDTNVPSFSNPSQDGPIIFTEGNVNFAPKPSNGLLPPIDPSVGQNDVNFQNQITTPATVNKFSFGGPTGVLGNAGVILGKIPEKAESALNKFSGSFGGSPGVLGGSSAINNGRQPLPSQIPVTVVQAPAPTLSVPAPTLSAPSANSFQGGFGGPAGVLVNEKFDKTTAQIFSSPSAPTFPTILNNKFSGNVGGANGILGDPISNASPSLQTPTTLAQLPPVISDTTQVTANRGSQKYTGNFGGLPGILLPYDNSKN